MKLSRADQIFEGFKLFHKNNPTILALFERFTFMSIERGRTHYSCDAVYERIRWHVDIETRGGTVKLNNNYRAYYARMFEAKHPQYAGFFRNRRRTSADREAYATDIQFWNTGAPRDEGTLTAELARL